MPGATKLFERCAGQTASDAPIATQNTLHVVDLMRVRAVGNAINAKNAKDDSMM